MYDLHYGEGAQLVNMQYANTTLLQESVVLSKISREKDC